MSLKDRIDQKSKALVQREPVALPRCGETVVVRGLMTAELTRVNAATEETRGLAVVCLATEDPEKPGEPLWNWNDLNDRAAAGALHIDDSTLIINTQNRLSGLLATDAELLKNSEPRGSGSISSPPATGFSPPTSENG